MILALIFIAFLQRVTGSCSFTGATDAPVAHLTNIATPTPFTFTDTNYVFDCATDPTTVSVWYTLDVAGTQYPGEFGNVLTYSAAPTVFATYTFPALIVTQFTPGEEVTVTWSLQPTGQIGSFSWTVPTQLAVVTTSSSTTSTSTSTTTTATATASSNSTSTQTPSTSSTPIGPIVGGVIGGVVAISAIVAFTWYKISTHRSRQLSTPEGAYAVQQITYTADKNPQMTIGEEEPQDRRVSLRYPEDEAQPPSGNVVGDY